MSSNPTKLDYQKLLNRIEMTEGAVLKGLQQIAALEPAAALAELNRQQLALIATINADRAETYSDRVTNWKIDAMLTFILQKNGNKIPLAEGSPENTPQKTISWYDQFLPKWKKFMADFQITTSEGVIPDEKSSPEQTAEITSQPTAEIKPIHPEDIPGNAVPFPAQPDRPSASQGDTPKAGDEGGGSPS